ncbi:MAG: hypothetical protein N2510_05175 [Ignavibacteria bacterium]|nr:hypothetical protein [Ignavibacteria bacterium]
MISSLQNIVSSFIKLLLSIILLYSCSEQPLNDYQSRSSSNVNNTDKINGVTIDGINGINNIVNSLARHNRKMTVRIVFDEWVPALQYQNAVNRIDSFANIMGEMLDSYYMSQYSVHQYKLRVEEYVGLLGDKVDIWEIGNEVNGEWLGHRDSVISKIEYAFRYVKKSGKVTALTLYYNKDCWENPENEMFNWVNNYLPQKMKLNLDYVLVSYYEDDCNNYQPEWQRVFDSLRVIFPNSKLGIGECGTTYPNRKAEYITRYYSMRITTPGYIGGYFWWYYRQDCVPWNTKPLWQVLENVINLN